MIGAGIVTSIAVTAALGWMCLPLDDLSWTLLVVSIGVVLGWTVATLETGDAGETA